MAWACAFDILGIAGDAKEFRQEGRPRLHHRQRHYPPKMETAASSLLSRLNQFNIGSIYGSVEMGSRENDIPFI
ncbi:hypothetical protein M8R20_23830, partial [Pseudomonas sp. R2.Fl]|nr:hypothetical protein [Pseudomonas sp. R2.Fl]